MNSGKLFRRTPFRWIVIGMCAVLLHACGGGGKSSSQENSKNEISGTYKPGILEIAKAEIEAVTLSTDSAAPGELLVSNPTQSFAKLKAGDVVMLAPSKDQGIPLGYTGVVVRNDEGTVVLRDANIEDVFEKLYVNFDTLESAAELQTIAIQSNQDRASAQAAPQWQGSLTGGRDGYTLTLQVARDLWSAEISGEIKIEGFRLSTITDFDLLRYPSTAGVNRLRYVVSGNTTSNIVLRPSVPGSGVINEMTWGDLFPKLAGGNYVWDNSKMVAVPGSEWLTGSTKYFSLSGLDSSDRNGLVPLGGVMITPAGPSAFVNQPGLAQQMAPLAFVVWVYIDAHGNVKFIADNTLLEGKSGAWKTGFDVVNTGGDLSASFIKDFGNPTLSSYVGGALGITQNIGLAVGADMVVSGMRPASAKIEVIGMEFSGKAESSENIALGLYPKREVALLADKDFCAAFEVNAYSEASFRLGLTAKSPIGDMFDFNYRKAASTGKLSYGSYGQTYAKNCPIRTVTKVASASADPKVTRICNSPNGPVNCDLYCTMGVAAGQETVFDGKINLLSFHRDGNGMIHFDANEPESEIAGSYSASSKVFLAQEQQEPTLVMSTGYINYFSASNFEVRSYVDPKTGKMSGFINELVTNSWSVDGATATCRSSITFDSVINWKVDPLVPLDL